MKNSPVLYREWRRLEDHELAPNQSPHSYGYGPEELSGTFLEFVTTYVDDTPYIEALVMRPDGTVLPVHLDGFRFDVLRTRLRR